MNEQTTISKLEIKNGSLILDGKPLEGVIDYEIKSSITKTAELFVRMIIELP